MNEMNVGKKKKAKDNTGNMPFSGYFKRDTPPEDAEITHTDPGTPLGEYMRRFWQPVCMSRQLTDVPLAIRIMGENLVAFRDREGNIGVLARQCCHRGASLEYGIIQDRGIRCCYHAFHYDIDGTIIDAPGELDRGERLRKIISQGAYPTLERDGLVFAYMGPPESKPAFPEYDAFETPGDTRLVPFTNEFPCNYLQVMDNIPDQMHTSLLHNPTVLYGGNVPNDLQEKMAGLYLSPGFLTVPVMDYVEVRDGTGMVFLAARRVADDLVWVRINDLIVPNISQHAYLFEDGAERRIFHRVHMSRWYVPVDDHNSIIFGWRMFGNDIDPLDMGREYRTGKDNIDFLDGQVGDRAYEEGQKHPGDWEAISSQRSIAVHAAENPMASDVGVYLNRKLIREGLRGTNPAATPEAMHERANAGKTSYCYTQNDILKIKRRADDEEDREMMGKLARDIVDVTAAADDLVGEERTTFITDGIEKLEASLQ